MLGCSEGAAEVLWCKLEPVRCAILSWGMAGVLKCKFEPVMWDILSCVMWDMGIDSESRVLVIGTEGNTDAEMYDGIIAGAL